MSEEKKHTETAEVKPESKDRKDVAFAAVDLQRVYAYLNNCNKKGAYGLADAFVIHVSYSNLKKVIDNNVNINTDQLKASLDVIYKALDTGAQEGAFNLEDAYNAKVAFANIQKRFEPEMRNPLEKLVSGLKPAST